MNADHPFPRIAVVGAGAVGGFFGGMLALGGAPVVMIGRQAFVDAVNRDGLFLDTQQGEKHVRVEASTELSAARGADVILFCVKTTDNAAVSRELASFLAPGAIVLSMQNGVDNAEQIRAASGIDALPVAVYVAAAATQPGRIKHFGRGDLVLGPANEKASFVAGMFVRAKVPCRITENMQGELWVKLIANCALNAASALGQARYRQIAGSEAGRKLMEAIVDEVFAVAQAAGVVLPGVANPHAAFAGALKVATDMAGQLSSTAFDLNRGKRTEIDSLNGFISRRGADLGVPTPVNQALYALIKLREDSPATISPPAA